MKIFEVLGVSSSIALNKENGYFAVGYFDESFISIHDYKTGELIHKLDTKYCSSANNVLACNGKYLVALYDSKTINVYDSKNFEMLSSFQLNNCGAVNSIILTDDLVTVTTNRALGKAEIKKDIFFFEIENKNLISYESGIYLRKAFFLNNEIFLMGNGQIGKSYIIPFSKKDEVKHELPFSIEEVLVYEQNTNKRVRVFINSGINSIGNINHNIDVYQSLNIHMDDEILDKTVGGFIGENELIKIVYKEENGNYKFCRYGEHDQMSYLDFEVITHSSDCDDSNYCFGADKSVIFIGVN